MTIKFIVNILFPYKTHLHILQLEDYQIARLIKWNEESIVKDALLPNKYGSVRTSGTPTYFARKI